MKFTGDPFKNEYVGQNNLGDESETLLNQESEKPNQEALESKRDENILEAINKVKDRLKDIEADKMVTYPTEGVLDKSRQFFYRILDKIDTGGEKDRKRSGEEKLFKAMQVVRAQLYVDHGVSEEEFDSPKRVELEKTYTDRDIKRMLSEATIDLPEIKKQASA